jgi:hypothetical protein
MNQVCIGKEGILNNLNNFEIPMVVVVGSSDFR